MVRFAVTPSPSKGPSTAPHAAQLALALVHPRLVPLERSPAGYSIPRELSRGWFELRPKRGLAGYGLARALRMLLDALEGLTALETTRSSKGQPFVHGELVPAMLRVDDTGVSRLIPLAPWHWSEPGTLPAAERCGHLAPERLLGDPIDARSDVFSAGTLLWEALAGRRLFETDSVDSIVMRLMGDKVTLPQLPPELSWALPLKAVAMCALSVDPEQRFANCRELAQAIESVAAEHVATHADVAHYFRSVIARPPSLPTHHSSLSALVAPARRSSKPVEPRPSESVEQIVAPPERRSKRSLWAIAAISCVLSAFGVSTLARFHASHGAAHNATQSPPLLGEPLPVAAPVLSVSAVASSAPVPVASSAAPAPVEGSAAPAPVEGSAVPAPIVTVPAIVDPALPPADDHEQATKAKKAATGLKGPAPKPRLPAKAVHVPDRAAAKYGI